MHKPSKHVSTKQIILNVIWKNLFLTICLLFIVVAVVLFSLLPPRILKLIIDDYLTNSVSKGLLKIAIFYLASYLFIGIFDFLKGILLTTFGQRIIRALRLEMGKKMTHLQASYFTKTPSGTIASHFMNDVDNVDSLFSDGVISMIIDCFKIVGILISIWLFNSRLGILVLCLLPFIYGITVFFRKRMLISQMNNLTEVGRVNNHIAESIRNILMIKVFHKEAYMENTYSKVLSDNYSTMNKVNFYDAAYSPIIQIVTALTTALILLLVSSGNTVFGITIGTLTATINLITNLFSPIDSLGMELQSIQKGLSGIKSIDTFLTQPEEEKVAFFGGNSIPALPSGITLSFENLSFSYTENEPILTDISFTIKPGEIVSLIGRTGAGKSTLFKLITGLLPPSGGQITLNGVNVYHIPAAYKRKIFGYVEQQFHFILGDIYAQISLFDETITKDMIENTMRFVGLHEYVMGLNNGYHTIADESTFSQGQKQLLSLARALVTNPPVLLLDEITSNLDSQTEEMVLSILKKSGKDKTILSISHRSSSLHGSDEVLLLENGHITRNQ